MVVIDDILHRGHPISCEQSGSVQWPNMANPSMAHQHGAPLSTLRFRRTRAAACCYRELNSYQDKRIILLPMARQTFIRYILKCPLRTLRFRLLNSFLIGYVSAGVVQATVFSTAYRSFSERITNGIAESFMGTFLYGTACCEFGTGVNLWPYIALTTAVVFLIWMVVGYIRAPLS
jgi:hypothetical protein